MPTYLSLIVTLRDVLPTAFREFIVPADANFADLHEAIQDAAPWERSHLYSFNSADATRREYVSSPDDEEAMAPEASTMRLDTYLANEGDRCLYLYDFGDGWVHDIFVRRVLELDTVLKRRLVGGSGSFPPEDCGGPDAYADILRVQSTFRTSSDEDDRLWAEWLDWRPVPFDLRRAKSAFDIPTSEETSARGLEHGAALH